MINMLQRKVAGRVFGIHVGVVLLLLSVSGLKGCFRREAPREMTMMVQFGVAAPPVAVESVDQLPETNRRPEPAPNPDPPDTTPDPPKQLALEQSRVVSPKPPKPRRRLARPDEIEIGPRVTPEAPAEPLISAEDLKKLRSVQREEGATAGPVGNPLVDNAYANQITRFFDRRWSQPPNASPIASAIVRVYISKWGTITKTHLLQGSGDSAYDAAVMALIGSVKTVARPPAGYSHEYVEIVFKTRN